MRVICRHGHFAFYPKNAKEIAKFSSYFETDLVRDKDFYTFETLQDAPRYSIMGLPFINLPALTTYEGREPWDVMRENGFVYNVALGLIVPKLSIVMLINPPVLDYCFLAESPLIQPGSRNLLGQQVLSYDGEFIQDNFQLRVTEVQYE